MNNILNFIVDDAVQEYKKQKLKLKFPLIILGKEQFMKGIEQIHERNVLKLLFMHVWQFVWFNKFAFS